MWTLVTILVATNIPTLLPKKILSDFLGSQFISSHCLFSAYHCEREGQIGLMPEQAMQAVMA